MKFSAFLRLTGLSALLAISSPALTIVFDYSHDLAGANFFGTNATAKTTLEQAGADISALISSTLSAITLANSQGISGTSGGTTATIDWRLTYTNPNDGTTVTINDFSAAANTVTIYVGARNLGGSTLGQGGPGGAGFGLGGSGSEGEWIAAVSAAEANSNSIMNRGGLAPIIGTISGGSPFGDTTAPYGFSRSSILGNLWFDMDTDNNGIADDSTLLNSFWHFDHSTAVDPLKFDFYSVALHEILHALGYGVSQTWSELVSGTEWLGANGIAENGTGAGLVDGGGFHLAASVGSTLYYSAGSQEVVMDPNIAPGERKFITDLDVAILKDLNYTISPVPEPSHYALLLGAVALAGVASRRRRRA